MQLLQKFMYFEKFSETSTKIMLLYLITQLSVSDIESVPRSSPKQELEELISSRLYPPSVNYSVQCNDSLPNTPLRCRIDVTGAEALTGHPPFFELTSSPARPQFNPQGNLSALA